MRQLVSYEPKTCEFCGSEFSRPSNQRGQIWATRRFCSGRCARKARVVPIKEQRPSRECVICEREFRSAPSSTQATCGDLRCKQAYKRGIAAKRLSERMRADYASGKRTPAQGVSPREQLLWPHLRDRGWVWRLRWFDAWGCFELDFALPDRKLNVEIDGEEHGWKTRGDADRARDEELLRRGWRIFRIANREVDESVEGVLARVLSWSESA